MKENEYKFSNVTLAEVKSNPIVNTFIKSANDYLGIIGYTEHGIRHVSLVASIAENVLLYLDYPKRLQELASIAGYLHDIGNVVNRKDHGQSAALISMRLLKDMGATPDEAALVISAIGNHEEEVGDPVNPVAAALILADKSDVHKTRVRAADGDFDIHDRVNDAVERSFLKVLKEKKIISLQLTIDTQKSQVMEYFEIFMSRMLMCRRAANFLDCNFELIINERKLL
ncbi:HD domain-containing protein [Endomicrobium proavitum]|uniref:Metal dependent phosphohydrolase n=1 Tax=Endomicrobium proavitum TaxID=1408281 RepID=A0A0G3WHV8_9BACT|nr:HD domain-containing protein [Endomicrobium proavitum]AKL97928.1 metal dependent phosphohydrolase [Endomicrobium proavitum]